MSVAFSLSCRCSFLSGFFAVDFAVLLVMKSSGWPDSSSLLPLRVVFTGARCCLICALDRLFSSSCSSVPYLSERRHHCDAWLSAGIGAGLAPSPSFKQIAMCVGAFSVRSCKYLWISIICKIFPSLFLKVFFLPFYCSEDATTAFLSCLPSLPLCEGSPSLPCNPSSAASVSLFELAWILLPICFLPSAGR